MSEAAVTLAQLFEAEGPDDDLRENIRTRVLAAMPIPKVVPLGSAAASLAGTLRGGLDTPVKDILGAGWNKWRELQRFRDPARYPADRVSDFKIDETQVIRMVRKPCVEVTLDGQSCVEVEFVVSAEFSVSAVVLKIRDARIIGAEVGRVWAEGRIKWGEAVLAERKTKELALGGEFSFGEGLEIGKPPNSTSAGA